MKNGLATLMVLVLLCIGASSLTFSAQSPLVMNQDSLKVAIDIGPGPHLIHTQPPSI